MKPKNPLLAAIGAEHFDTGIRHPKRVGFQIYQTTEALLPNEAQNLMMEDRELRTLIKVRYRCHEDDRERSVTLAEQSMIDVVYRPFLEGLRTALLAVGAHEHGLAEFEIQKLIDMIEG